MNKDLIVFDWEVFPNWNCTVHVKYSENVTEADLKVITSDDLFYREDLNAMSEQGYLVGFNIKQYDMQIHNFACRGYTPIDLYEHSMSIINSKDRSWKDITYWNKFNFIDLYDDIKTMGSLKQFESNTGMSIEECPVPFGKEDLTEEDKHCIIQYCKQDVMATCKLLKARWGYLMQKANCSRISSISEEECLKNTSAKLCAKMLGAKKTENYEEPYYQIPERLDGLFRENLHPRIIEQFDGTELINDFEYSVNYLKNKVNFGTGGIHSTYKDSLTCITDNDYVLVNADFENLYPSLEILFEYYSVGIPEKGREQFKFILAECRRLKQVLREMKAAGKKNTPEFEELFGERDSMKLVLNASTGAMRAQFSPLYDPQNIIALCFTGQLLTICMAKIVHDLGALVLQTNTDGILFKIKRYDLQTVIDKLNWFSDYVGIPLEIETQYAVFQKDVNNYILLSKPNAEPKLKGRWAKQSGSDVPLTPLFAPVINQSIIDYYCKNIPIEDTIRNCKKPLDFMITTMKGPTYTSVMHEIDGIAISCQNINRVYATTDKGQGTLYKIRVENDEIIKKDKIASIPDNCRIFNAAVPDELTIEDLDYDWYIKLAKKNLIEMERV